MRAATTMLGVPTIPLTLALCAALGCAAQGGEDGGASRLPDRGIAGWERQERELSDPFVIGAPDGDRIGGASALVLDGTLFVYGHRLVADGGAELVRARADGEGFAPIETLTLEGEGMRGRDPSVIVDPEGAVWVAWVDEDVVAMARSDDGVGFASLPSSGLEPERSAPSLVLDGERVRLFLSHEGVIVHAEASRATLAFGPETEVFGPGTDCVDRSGATAPCWDEGAIVEAEVRRATSPPGEVVYRMFYAGRGGAGDSDVGFAASYDGLEFSRYPYNPVLADTRDELSPTSALHEGRYLLFWSETRSSRSAGVLRATHPPSAPADRW